MKKITALACLLALVVNANAQKTEISHGKLFLGGAENPVSMVELENFTRKEVEKKWTSYLKKHKGKVSDDDDEIFHDNALISSISNDTLDTWSTVSEAGKVVVVTLTVNKGGAFLSNDSGIDGFLYDFAVNIKKEKATDEVDAAAKTLKSLEKDYESLEKDNKKMEENIKDMKNKISDHERTIKQNEEAMKKTQKEIESARTGVKVLEERLKGVN